MEVLEVSNQSLWVVPTLSFWGVNSVWVGAATPWVCAGLHWAIPCENTTFGQISII